MKKLTTTSALLAAVALATMLLAQPGTTRLEVASAEPSIATTLTTVAPIPDPTPTPAPAATDPGQPQGTQDNDTVAHPTTQEPTPVTTPAVPAAPDNKPATTTCVSDPANPKVLTSTPPAPAGFCSWLDFASLPHDTVNPPAPYASWADLMNHPPVMTFEGATKPFNMNDPSTFPPKP